MCFYREMMKDSRISLNEKFIQSKTCFLEKNDERFARNLTARSNRMTESQKHFPHLERKVLKNYQECKTIVQYPTASNMC